MKDITAYICKLADEVWQDKVLNAVMTEDDDTDAGLADGTTNSNQSKIEDDSDDDDNKKPFKVERDVSGKNNNQALHIFTGKPLPPSM